jgi:hypothetical protein
MPKSDFAPMPRTVGATRPRFPDGPQDLRSPRQSRSERGRASRGGRRPDRTGESVHPCPARSLLTRDPQGCHDQPRGERPPRNPRQGFSQSFELALDQIGRGLGCAGQLPQFRVPAAAAGCKDATYAALCLVGTQAQAGWVSKQSANEMRRWSPPSRGTLPDRSALTRWAWGLGRRSGACGIGDRG